MEPERTTHADVDAGLLDLAGDAGVLQERVLAEGEMQPLVCTHRQVRRGARGAQGARTEGE